MNLLAFSATFKYKTKITFYNIKYNKQNTKCIKMQNITKKKLIIESINITKTKHIVLYSIYMIVLTAIIKYKIKNTECTEQKTKPQNIK